MYFKTEDEKKKIKEKIINNKGNLPSIEVILELLKKGMSQTEIGQRYKVSRQSVNNLIAKYEVNKFLTKKKASS